MVHAMLYCHVFCCGHSVSGRLRAALLVPWRFDAALCVISSDHVRGAWWKLVSSRRITPPRKFPVSKQIAQAVCLAYDPPTPPHAHIRALTNALPRLPPTGKTYLAARPSRRASGCVNLYTHMRRFSSQLNKLSPRPRTCPGSGISRPATRAKFPNSRRSLLLLSCAHVHLTARAVTYIPGPTPPGRTSNPTRSPSWQPPCDVVSCIRSNGQFTLHSACAYTGRGNSRRNEPRQRRRWMASPVSRPIQFYPSVRKNPDVSDNERVL